MNHHHHHAINDAFPSPPSPSPTPEDHSNHSFSLWGLLFGSHELCKLLKIEINLLLTVILVILIFYLGLKRRSSRSPGLSRVLFLAYVGFSTTISYTMGMIYDSTLNHALFAMWAGLVLNAYLSIDTIVAYSLMDHEKRRRYFLELFLLGCFFWWIMFNHNRPLYLSLPTFALWMLMWMKASERLQAFEMACRSGLAQFAKPTADFMEKMSKQSMNREVGYFANPSTMSGYKYLLEDPDECDNEEKNTMTLERLWQFEGGILSSIDGIHFAKLKDTCLSFALFKLLLRRFAGYTMHEANQKKTWRFVRYGLVDHQGYARPFQVIGVYNIELFTI